MFRYAITLCSTVVLAQGASSSDQHSIGNIFQTVTTPGQHVVDLGTLVTLICGGIFLVVAALIAYAAFRYRRRRDDDLEEPPQVFGSNQIEAAWTVIPLLIVFVLIMVTARVVASVQDVQPPKNALRAEVVGHQWWWEIRYPGLDFVTANELNVPQSTQGERATFLTLASADVIHSYWVPQFGGKMDLIPNRNNQMWFDPKELGTFYGNCAEYCGTQHANMLIRVVVRPPDEFARWVEAQKKPAVADPAVAEEQAVFESLSCANCHMIRGTNAQGKFGPDLTHLMSRRTIAGGMIRNNRENLRAWLKDPQEMKPGCLMPSMLLTEQQLNALVTYLTTLK